MLRDRILAAPWTRLGPEFSSLEGESILDWEFSIGEAHICWSERYFSRSLASCVLQVMEGNPDGRGCVCSGASSPRKACNCSVEWH